MEQFFLKCWVILRCKFNEVKEDHKAQMRSPVMYTINDDGKWLRPIEDWEKKLSEVSVLVFQLIFSIMSSIKLIRALLPDKIWKSPK